jgi:hypothetical protein
MKRKNVMLLVFIGLIVINMVIAVPVFGKIDPETVVAFWLLDDAQGKTAADSSVNGYNGTITGSEWVDGKFGKALSFNGKTDQVSVPDAEGLDGIPQITILTWVKYNKEPPQNYAPVGKEPLYRFIIGKGSSGHFVLATTGAGWYANGTVASGSGITPGEWHHLVGTYDGTKVRFYVDGKLAGEGPVDIAGDILNNADAFVIAKSIANNVDFLEGIVDDVAVFSVALGETDIKSIMAVGLAKAIAGDSAVSTMSKLASTWAKIKVQ